MKAETLSVVQLPDYESRAVRIANEILARADRFDVAGTAFTMRHFVELQARLRVLADARRPFRILLWPDPARTSPDAIAGSLAIEGVQVAFGAASRNSAPTDFLISDGKELTVLAASLRLLYPDVVRRGRRGRHGPTRRCPSTTRPSRSWPGLTGAGATRSLVDEELLAAFRRQAEACTTQFVEGDLVRSTNELYTDYGIGRIQKVRKGQAKVEFNPSVFMHPPYRSENKILQLGEMEKVDTPLDRALAGNWDEPWRFELKMLAARFLTGNKGGPAFQCPHRNPPAPDFCRAPRGVQSKTPFPAGR